MKILAAYHNFQIYSWFINFNVLDGDDSDWRRLVDKHLPDVPVEDTFEVCICVYA